MDNDRKRLIRDWTFLALCAATVLSTISLVRPMEEWLKSNGVLSILVVGPIVLIFFVLVILAIISLARPGQGRAVRLFYLLNIAIAYFLLFQVLGKFPVERAHLVVYGAAGILALRVAWHYKRGIEAYALAFTMTFFLGFMDEAIQYFTPGRVYDPRDVATDAISGLMGLLVCAVLSKRAAKKD